MSEKQQSYEIPYRIRGKKGDRQQVITSKPKSYAPGEIVQLRHKLNLTQSQFALAFGVTNGTIASWERGYTNPEGPSHRLLQLFDKEPSLLQHFMETE